MSQAQATPLSGSQSGWEQAATRFLEEAGWFDASWYLGTCPEAASSGIDPLRHYLEHGTCAGRGPNAWIDALRRALSGTGDETWTDLAREDGGLDAEIEFLRASGEFDSAYYLENNPDVASSGADPLRHFCEFGWRELRKPRAGFDVWWYWVNHLDPSREAVNPLVHYVLVGRRAGHTGAPAHYAPGPGRVHAPGATVRRICLFAGYDQDGIVDDYVVAYLRELSRFAEIYYLADGHMADGELEKLRPYTKACWAYRHGAYDFGSWAALARDHVGWEEIGRYDELILANDSCYLLRGLDHVFAKMDRRPCDWWGMQATKGIARTRYEASNLFPERIAIDVVKREMVDAFERDYLYDFLVGSYFLIFRRSVTADSGFRRLIEGVRPQSSKLRIIQKYEIGITHFLVGKQYAFDTYIDHLYPFHPIYTRYHFDLIREGFPFLKRYFLSQNHYDTPGLARWKIIVRDLVPAADVEMLERNLLRVSDHDKLHRSFRIVEDESGKVVVPTTLSNEAFVKADHETPKFDHWWAFPACAFDDTFAGNERAVFEEVRDDPSIKKIVLSRRKEIRAEGENVVVVPLDSPEGQYYLLRAKQIFVKHSPSINAKWPLSAKLHNFINLWHGIPLKRFGHASLDMADKLEWVHAENRKCRAVITSSKMDTLAMAAAFYPLSYREMWATGLPRNDFILREEAELPADLREQGARLREQVAGRRLVLFLPTFKNSQEEGYYRFGEEELAFLRDWLARNNAVLGVREHMADKARTYSRMLSPLGILDLSSKRYPDIEMLYRAADLLVTDYSSCAIDFMLTGRPVISFAYDYEHYANTERGLFYDLEHVFPGPVCRNFDELADALEGVVAADANTPDGVQALKRKVFFDYIDDVNAWRVASRVKALYVAAGAPAPEGQAA